jgi:hypothetical protein
MDIVRSRRPTVNGRRGDSARLLGGSTSPRQADQGT